MGSEDQVLPQKRSCSLPTPLLTWLGFKEANYLSALGIFQRPDPTLPMLHFPGGNKRPTRKSKRDACSQTLYGTPESPHHLGGDYVRIPPACHPFTWPRSSASVPWTDLLLHLPCCIFFYAHLPSQRDKWASTSFWGDTVMTYGDAGSEVGWWCEQNGQQSPKGLEAARPPSIHTFPEQLARWLPFSLSESSGLRNEPWRTRLNAPDTNLA